MTDEKPPEDPKPKSDLRFGTQDERLQNANVENRGPCRDCGGTRWFDIPNSWVCVNCAKTHGKSNSEEDAWKPKDLTQPPKDERPKLAEVHMLITNTRRIFQDLISPDPAIPFTATEHFQTYPELLRQDDGIVNVHHLKKLNIAATLEALSAAIQQYENYKGAETGAVVASLSGTMLRLLQDLQKSQDPVVIIERIEEEVLAALTHDMLRAITVETKWMIDECRDLIPPERFGTFEHTVKTAIGRVGPAMTASIAAQRERLKVLFNLKKDKVAKEKPPK